MVELLTPTLFYADLDEPIVGARPAILVMRNSLDGRTLKMSICCSGAIAIDLICRTVPWRWRPASENRRQGRR